MISMTHVCGVITFFEPLASDLCLIYLRSPSPCTIRGASAFKVRVIPDFHLSFVLSHLSGLIAAKFASSDSHGVGDEKGKHSGGHLVRFCYYGEWLLSNANIPILIGLVCRRDFSPFSSFGLKTPMNSSPGFRPSFQKSRLLRQPVR